MSFEGAYENICNNGHFFETSCYVYDPDTECPICGAVIAWRRLRDDTNGDDVSFPIEKFEILAPLREVVVEDGRYVTRLMHGVYRIPTKEEANKVLNEAQKEEFFGA